MPTCILEPRMHVNLRSHECRRVGLLYSMTTMASVIWGPPGHRSILPWKRGRTASIGRVFRVLSNTAGFMSYGTGSSAMRVRYRGIRGMNTAGSGGAPADTLFGTGKTDTIARQGPFDDPGISQETVPTRGPQAEEPRERGLMGLIRVHEQRPRDRCSARWKIGQRVGPAGRQRERGPPAPKWRSSTISSCLRNSRTRELPCMVWACGWIRKRTQGPGMIDKYVPATASFNQKSQSAVYHSPSSRPPARARRLPRKQRRRHRDEVLYQQSPTTRSGIQFCISGQGQRHVPTRLPAGSMNHEECRNIVTLRRRGDQSPENSQTILEPQIVVMQEANVISTSLRQPMICLRYPVLQVFANEKSRSGSRPA